MAKEPVGVSKQFGTEQQDNWGDGWFVFKALMWNGGVIVGALIALNLLFGAIGE